MDVYCATFLRPEQRTIESVCSVETSPDGYPELIAVGLSSGGIQLLDRNTWLLICEIPGSSERSVRCLASKGTRLFSAGVHGSITEWDLVNMKETFVVDSNNGAIWDMKISGDRLIVGTESGSALVYTITDYDLDLKATLKSAKKGLRCLSVIEESGYIFTGDAAGTISRWSLSRSGGTCDETMSLERKGQDTLVWQLVGLGDGRIVSGDSLGCVSVWDAKLCIRSQVVREHQADILSLCRVGTSLFSGSVDSKITHFIIGESILAKDCYFQHTRDVQAICGLPDGRIITGGADGYLAVLDTSRRSFAPMKLDRLVHAVSSSSDCALHISLGGAGGGARLWSVKPEPICLADLSLGDSSHVSLATISPSGACILISGLETCRILSFDLGNLGLRRRATARRCFTRAALTDERAAVCVGKDLYLWKFVDGDFSEASEKVACSWNGVITSCMFIEDNVVIGTSFGEIAVISRSLEVTAATQVKQGEVNLVICDLTEMDGALIALAGGAVCAFDLSLTLRWRRALRRVKGVAKPEASQLRGVEWSSSSRSLMVWGERKLVTLTVSLAGEISESRAVDTVQEGFGLLQGVSTSSAAAQVKKRRLQPAEAAVVFGSSVTSIEASLPAPFERKCFHK